MSKLIGSEIGANRDLVTAVKDDKSDAVKLKSAIWGFINKSTVQNENGKTLDGEIWNNIRERFTQCATANDNRKDNSENLANAIEEANKDLRSYMAEAPIPEDPNTQRIDYYKALSYEHYELYIYYCRNKTKIVGYWTDVDYITYPIYDYDYDAQRFHYLKYRLYKLQYEWLEKLVPTDNSVTVKVYSVDLTGMTVEAF